MAESVYQMVVTSSGADSEDDSSLREKTCDLKDTDDITKVNFTDDASNATDSTLVYSVEKEEGLLEDRSNAVTSSTRSAGEVTLNDEQQAVDGGVQYTNTWKYEQFSEECAPLLENSSCEVSHKFDPPRQSIASTEDSNRAVFEHISSDSGHVESSTTEIAVLNHSERMELRKRHTQQAEVQTKEETVEMRAGKWTMQKQPVIRLLSKVKLGRSIMIEGQIDQNASSFSINLQTSSRLPPDTDILFMLGFNFSDSEVSMVCDSYLYECWGIAEHHKEDRPWKTFPFCRGEKFSLRIAMTRANFQVYHEDVLLMSYTHRTGIDRLSHVRCEGDFTLINIECPRLVSLPYMHELPFGLRRDQTIVMDAFIKKAATSFQMQITAKHKNVYTGFFIRISFSGNITKVFCQGFYNDKMEEKMTIDGNLPIIPDMEIEIRASILENQILILVDGDWFAEYEHKLPLAKLSQLTIDGDILLYGVHITEPRGKLSRTKARRCCNCVLL